MIDNTDNYLVIEVPHQRAPRAESFDSPDDATNYYWEQVAGTSEYVSWLKDNGYDPDEDGVDGDDTALWEFVAHDLHALYRYTKEEAREQLAWLDKPSAGSQKIHQQLSVAAALRDFVGRPVIEFRTTNATDHILLVRAGSVVGQWDATPDSALDFASTEILGDGSADDWEETWPDVTDPDAWGERLDGDKLAMSICKILREDRWSAENIVPAIAAKLCVESYAEVAAENLTPLTGQESLPSEDDENFLAELLDRAPAESELDKFRSEFWEIWFKVSTSKGGA